VFARVIFNDLVTSKCRKYFRFLLLVRAQLFQQVRERSSRNFLSWYSVMGVDDCCEMGLRSLKGRCRGNQFLFIQSAMFFRRSNQCVINFVHSATTRSAAVSVIHEVDRRRFLLTTPIHRGTDNDPLEIDISPWTFAPLDISPTLA